MTLGRILSITTSTLVLSAFAPLPTHATPGDLDGVSDTTSPSSVEALSEATQTKVNIMIESLTQRPNGKLSDLNLEEFNKFIAPLETDADVDAAISAFKQLNGAVRSIEFFPKAFKRYMSMPQDERDELHAFFDQQAAFFKKTDNYWNRIYPHNLFSALMNVKDREAFAATIESTHKELLTEIAQFKKATGGSISDDLEMFGFNMGYATLSPAERDECDAIFMDHMNGQRSLLIQGRIMAGAFKATLWEGGFNWRQNVNSLGSEIWPIKESANETHLEYWIKRHSGGESDIDREIRELLSNVSRTKAILFIIKKRDFNESWAKNSQAKDLDKKEADAFQANFSIEKYGKVKELTSEEKLEALMQYMQDVTTKNNHMASGNSS